MNTDQIAYHIENAPSLKLLRYEASAFVLGFLQEAFKKQGVVQIKYSDLVSMLDAFIVEHQDLLRSNAKASARHLIDQWSDDKHRFLRKYYEADSDEPVTELTYAAEQAMEWLQSLEKKEFVGAQSRFYAIFDNLSQLAGQSSADPKERLAYLNRERDKIDKDIATVKKGGPLAGLDRVEIKERFLNIMDDARRLVADFRLIEDIFKDLTRKIKEQKLQAQSSKGSILAQVLDIHDYLEESDQGKSFRSFWAFLMSPDKQDELKKLSAQILDLPEIRAFVAQYPERNYPGSLLRLKSQLLQVGQKVLASQYRLSKELRNLLHHEALLENKRVLQQVFAIKRLCLLHRESLKAQINKTLVELEFFPDIRLPLERPLWRWRGDAEFMDRQSLMHGQAQDPGRELEAFLQPIDVHRLELEERINQLLANNPWVSLDDVTTAYPVKHGSAELVTYLAIACESSQHLVDSSEQVAVKFSSLRGSGTLSMPQIIFHRAQAVSLS